MWFFKRSASSPPPVPPASAEQIIGAFDPWTLACAVGATNGTVGVCIGYNAWLSLSRKNWMPQVKEKLHGIAEDTITGALLQYVLANSHRDHKSIFSDECEKRGHHPQPVIGPGETITIRLGL